jgi:hypothetical protein
MSRAIVVRDQNSGGWWEELVRALSEHSEQNSGVKEDLVLYYIYVRSL